MKVKSLLRGMVEARGFLSDLRETIDAGTKFCVVAGEHAGRLKASTLEMISRVRVNREPPLKISVTAVRSR